MEHAAPLAPSVIADDRLRPLSRAELERYRRNALVPQVGVTGQQRVRAARVLLVGAGGLGSPAALYLAAAGTGTLGVVDDDVVDVSNLQRQVVHTTAAVGAPKADSAAAAVRALNPDVEVVIHRERLTAANALGLLEGWDVVVDGSDNFPTRYLVNDACVMLGLPLVHGAVLGLNGQVGVFDAARGPCYRCLHPAPPPPGSVPSCAQAGVLGVLPGVIGSMQAAEALKLVIGGARPLIGRLVLLDVWGGSVRELTVSRNPACPVCGEHPSITTLADAPGAGSCATAPGRRADSTDPTSAPGTGVASVTPARLKELLEAPGPPALLDVRQEVEVALDPFPGARNIPLGQVVDRTGELDAGRTTVVVCASGLRSAQAVQALREAGYPGELLSLAGGARAWTPARPGAPAPGQGDVEGGGYLSPPGTACPPGTAGTVKPASTWSYT